MHDLGFIITRHVMSDVANQYWIESCRCIRLFHPDTQIIIIDDNSNQSFVKGDLPTNCTVVSSEYPGKAELLPYLYLKKYKPFRKAAVLHDSVFLTAPMPFDKVTNVKFMWHFEKMPDWEEHIKKLCSVLPEGDDLVNTFLNETWRGCFGVQSVITLDFLDSLPIELLVEQMTVYESRHALERVFALMCEIRRPSLVNDPSLFGLIYDVHGGWGYKFNQYIANVGRHPIRTPIKVWSGR